MPDPRILKMETSSKCNARCVFCGHPPGGEFMSWELFTAVIDAFPGAREVQPQWYGEPLMWPHLAAGIRYIHDAGKSCVFYTNGALLDGPLALEIAAAAPRAVIFSVDTHIPEVYEAIRPPLSFERVRENIETFQRIKNPGTRTIVRACATQETDPTMDATVAYWESRVDTVVVKPEFPHTREVAAAIYPTCTLPSYEMVVRADGQVVLCCNDWHSEALLGDVSGGIREAWELYSRWANEPHELCKGCNLRWTASS